MAPYNGSGTFTLAEAAFVPNTVISSSVMNSDLSDIATNGLTNAITKDGQTTITGALKGASGSVGLPSYAFSADPDTGMYRIAANNIGISVGGSKILDIASTGLTVTGSFSPSTTFVAPAGTVLLPSYTFSGDLDTGIYEIGANNIGVAVNAAKVLDISASGLNVIGAVSANGVALAPQAQAAGMVNGTIVESHAGNAVTFAVKTLAGGDPSPTDIVYFVFRNVTAATGNYVVLQVTAALSLTVSSGSTVGTVSSNIPFKLWHVAFNDAGTVRLGVINTVLGGATPTSVYPLGQIPIASSTAEGGAGGADSAQVFYTGTAVSSKAYAVLGYAAYETGVTTAGSWAASPTRIQLFGLGVPLPGTPFQPQQNATGAVATGTTVIPSDDTIPQSTEGDQYLSQVITPTSAANILEIISEINIQSGAASGSSCTSALFQDSTANALRVGGVFIVQTSSSIGQSRLSHSMLALTTSSTTFKIRAGASAAGTTTINGSGSGRLYGGTFNSTISIKEIMT